MADSRAEEIVKQGDALFAGRDMSDWQETAEHFYTERATFYGGTSDAASSLFNSYPVMARRELGNMLAVSLRPRTSRWFSPHVDDENMDNDPAVREWLEFAGGVQWRTMYDPVADMIRATKEADHDYVTFGNAVLKVERNYAVPALLFRSYHLRDAAWSENASKQVDLVHLNLELTARQLTELFPKTVSRDVTQAATKEPEKKFKCRHVIVPNSVYTEDGQRRGQRGKFTSLYVECESRTTLEQAPQGTLGYVIPRWQSISDSQYARSLATEIARPDARALQAVSRTMQEAGEKYVDPPMLYYKEAIQGGLNLYAGGATAVDAEYDERTGDPLRPIVQDRGGLPIGIDLMEKLQNAIFHAFFLDKLQLPVMDAGKMTAFEIQRRIEEHVRSSAPLFEPIEHGYSSPLCMEIFQQLRDLGTFGPVALIPRPLQEKIMAGEIRFTFQSPLREVAEQAMTGQFMEGLKVLQTAAAFDQAQLANVDMTEGTRDALRALSWKQKWFKPKEAVDQARQMIAEQQKMEKGAAAIGQGAEVAKSVGEAAQAWSDAGINPGLG